MTRALQAFIWFMWFDMFARGIDYITGNQFNTGLVDDNLTMPEVWGAASLVTCAVLAVGMFTKRLSVVQFGAILGFAVYVMFAVQVFQVRMLPYPWPPEDVRMVAGHVSTAGMWLVVAVTLWYRRYANQKCREELGIEVHSG